MTASKQNHRNLSGGVPPLTPLAQRVRHYFHEHPEITREQFLLEAVWREIRLCEQREASGKTVAAQGGSEGTGRWRDAMRPQSAEDLRQRASLAERLALLHYERHGLWPRVRRFLAGLRFSTPSRAKGG